MTPLRPSKTPFSPSMPRTLGDNIATEKSGQQADVGYVPVPIYGV